MDVAGKRVLVRVDFNVPLEEGRIVDDTRIQESLPTIKDLVGRRARVLLLTHLGRPDGKVVEAMRTTPLAVRLSQLLGKPVQHVDDCVGPEVEAAVSKLRDGDVLMLENVRFHKEETRNDPEFSRRLASLADVYINDAFGTAHRAHASTVGVTAYLPAVAGLLMEREISTLGRIMQDPPRPLVAVIGGSKISTKIGVLQSLLERVDRLCLGGAMACTFFKARGLAVGRSLVEDDQLETATRLSQQADQAGRSLVLPLDAVVAPQPRQGATARTVAVDAIPEDQMVLDVGPMTVERFLAGCEGAAAVVWNGPLGVYEVPPFEQGTINLARGLAGTGAQTIIGGGDLVAALKAAGLADRMSFLSTGGGATLEFLEGKELPGIAALREAVNA